mmetsp:Transcript_4172/g.9427  ORF Transcript_4172/g.9427 Transcript_4172/m.9427 type:complete len:155 (+) Transcript_4172:2-466(+)
MGYEDEWGMEELLHDAHKELVAALGKPGHTLFCHLSPAGQMQRLDLALVEYYTQEATKDLEQAAKVAIRMLVEDDYVLGEAAQVSLKVLIDWIQDTQSEKLGGRDSSDVRSDLFQYRQRVSDVIALQFSRDKRSEFARASYRACNSGDFCMEMF